METHLDGGHLLDYFDYLYTKRNGQTEKKRSTPCVQMRYIVSHALIADYLLDSILIKKGRKFV